MKLFFFFEWGSRCWLAHLDPGSTELSSRAPAFSRTWPDHPLILLLFLFLFIFFPFLSYWGFKAEYGTLIRDSYFYFLFILCNYKGRHGALLPQNNMRIGGYLPLGFKVRWVYVMSEFNSIQTNKQKIKCVLFVSINLDEWMNDRSNCA